MNARFALMLRDPSADLEALAQLAEEGGRQAGRITCLARLLARELAKATTPSSP